MGKTAMEPKIHEEFQHYIDYFIKPNLGKAFSMSVNINQATCNIISQLLYSRRFDYDDPHYNEMISALEEIVALNTKVAMTENLPFANYFLKSILKREDYLSNSIVTPNLQSYIDEHRSSIDRDHPRDVTDRYIIHSESSGGDKSCFSGKFV